MALSNMQSRGRSAGSAAGRFFGLLSLVGLAIAGSFDAGCAGSPREASAATAFEEDATPESLPNFALRWLFGVGMGHKLHIESLQLYYLDPVTEQEARATGSFLRQLGIGQHETLVQLRKSTDASTPTYELRIGTPFSRKEHIDHETRTVYQLMALAAEGMLFDGAPVQVSLCNPLLQPLVILRPRLKPQSGPKAESDVGTAGGTASDLDVETAGAAEASGEALRIPVR